MPCWANRHLARQNRALFLASRDFSTKSFRLSLGLDTTITLLYFLTALMSMLSNDSMIRPRGSGQVRYPSSAQGLGGQEAGRHNPERQTVCASKIESPATWKYGRSTNRRRDMASTFAGNSARCSENVSHRPRPGRKIKVN
jgi:hypothetical protein